MSVLVFEPADSLEFQCACRAVCVCARERACACLDSCVRLPYVCAFMCGPPCVGVACVVRFQCGRARVWLRWPLLLCLDAQVCVFGRYHCLLPVPHSIFHTPIAGDTSGYFSNLYISNVSDSSPVAFKVKTTSPDRYLVRPNQGVLGANTGNLEVRGRFRRHTLFFRALHSRFCASFAFYVDLLAWWLAPQRCLPTCPLV